VLIQIYGLTTVADAVGVDHLGVDHIGVVVDEGIDTWDSVDEATAQAIASNVQSSRLVALSLSTDPERVIATAALLNASIAHLARADQMPTATLDQLRVQLAPTELMVTVPVRGERDLVEAARLADVADYLLLDSSDPLTGIVGATGVVHDWDVSARIVASARCPVILAGGLGPDNVADAITQVRPAGVDSETRTSSDGDRRRKDLAKVEAFIHQARAAAVP
jgi:phosphoribosylanthranilate isomerase